MFKLFCNRPLASEGDVMRLAVILGILPWVFFLGFFNDTLLGVKFGVIAGFACLLLFNYQALKKGALLDWVAVVFFLSIGVLGWFLELPFVIHNSLLMENSVFFIASILTLVTHKPFSLEYAKTKVNEVYYQHPVFRRVHGWISFVWSVIFLTGAVLIILYRFGLGNSTWMLQNIPTNLILLGVLFTIFFPDLYQRAMMKGGVSSLPGLSGVKTVEIQGGAIGYRTIGRGPLLILLQGAKMNMHGWDPVLLKHLSRHFTVLIWDYPGMGYSSDNQCEWTTEAMARLLKKICDKLELKPLALMGYSMGGFIALRNMVISKDIKAGVIWGGVVGSYPDLLNNWRRSNFSPSPLPSGARRWRQQLTEQYGNPDQNPEFWASISANSFLADISGPLQLHHGTADPSVPFSFSQKLESQMKTAGKEVELNTYEGDDHNLSTNFSTAMRRSIEFFDRYLK